MHLVMNAIAMCLATVIIINEGQCATPFKVAHARCSKGCADATEKAVPKVSPGVAAFGSVF